MFETKKPFGVKEKEVPLCSIKPFFTYKSVFLKKLCGNGVPYFWHILRYRVPFQSQRQHNIFFGSAALAVIDNFVCFKILYTSVIEKSFTVKEGMSGRTYANVLATFPIA